MNTHNGKCPRCLIRYVWTGNLKLKEARCEQCGEPLSATTHLSKLPVEPLNWWDKKGKLHSVV